MRQSERLTAERESKMGSSNGIRIVVRHGKGMWDYQDVEDMAQDFNGQVVDSGDDGRHDDYSEIFFDTDDDGESFFNHAIQRYDLKRIN